MNSIFRKLSQTNNVSDQLRLLKQEKMFYVNIRKNAKSRRHENSFGEIVSDCHRKIINSIQTVEDLIKGKLMLHRNAPASQYELDFIKKLISAIRIESPS